MRSPLQDPGPAGQISFRPAGAADRDFLYRLYCDTRDWEFRLARWSDAAWADFLAGQFAARERHYRMAYPEAVTSVTRLDGAEIGALCLDRSEAGLRIVDIALLASHCGQGIGSAILRALMREAEAGRQTLRLSVIGHSPALRLYTRLGFVPAGDGDKSGDGDPGVHLDLEWRAPTDGLIHGPPGGPEA